MVTPEQKIAVVDELLDILDVRGWTRASYENGYGEVCVLGAFGRLNTRMRVMSEESEEYANYQTREIVKRDLEILVGNIPGWNDRLWRSYGSVKRKLHALRRQYERQIVRTREHRLYDALAEKLVIERGRKEARQSEFAVTPLPPLPDVTQNTTPERIKTTV